MPPTETATAPELRPLHEEFAEALKSQDDGTPATQPAKTEQQPSVSKETKTQEQLSKSGDTKQEVKKPDAAQPKKKSALDAALFDEAPASKTNPEHEEAEKIYDGPATNEAWIKSKQNFKKLSDELAAYKEKLAKPEIPAEIQAELTAAKELKAQIAAIKAENDKLRDGITAVDVRYEPGNQEKYVVGRNRQVESLAARVAENGGDKEAFLMAMEMPLPKRGKALDVALENVTSPRELAKINEKLAGVESLDEEWGQMLSNPTKSHEQMTQQRELAAREAAERAEQVKVATFEKVARELPKLSKLMRMVPEDAEGGPEYNEQLQKDIENAPSYLQPKTREEAAIWSFKVARYDSVEKIATERFAKDAAKIAELETELARYHGAEPGFQGGRKPAAKADYEVPIGEAFMRALNQQSPVP